MSSSRAGRLSRRSEMLAVHITAKRGYVGVCTSHTFLPHHFNFTIRSDFPLSCSRLHFISVSVKPLYSFNWTSGHFEQYLWHQNRIFLTRLHDISSRVCGGKTGCFQGNVWTFSAVCGTKLNDIFGETLQHVQLCYWQQHRVFLTRRNDISSCVYWWQNGIFLTFPATFAATKMTLRWHLQARDHCLRCHVNIQYVSMQPLVTFDKICDIFQPRLWQRNQVDNPTHHLLYLNLTRP